MKGLRFQVREEKNRRVEAKARRFDRERERAHREDNSASRFLRSIARTIDARSERLRSSVGIGVARSERAHARLPARLSIYQTLDLIVSILHLRLRSG